MVKPHTQTLDTLLETIHLFGDFLVVLLSWPVQIICAWYKGVSFTLPWNPTTTDEDLQSVGSNDSRPQSRSKQRPQVHTRQRSAISTNSTQDSTDGLVQQIWYPPPPAYEEEDHSQVRPPSLPVPSLAPGLYPSTHGPDEWRKYPDFPAAYPLSPVLDPTPPPGFRIVAPVPQRPSNVIDIDNISNSGQDDESADTETQPGFHRSLLLSREFMSPNSVVHLSDENPTYGVQLEDRTKRKRKRLTLEGGGDTTDADEEMDEDVSDDEDAGDETFTTPRIRTVTVDSDAEMGDASGSEEENSFNLQTPLPRRNGKRTKSNLTIRRPSSTATLNPRKSAQDTRLKIKVYPASPPHHLPPHLAPQISTMHSGSSVRSASTTLSTQAGGDSLMTGDGSERDELETPLSPGFPSPTTYTVDASSEVHPPFPIPDVDPNFTVPVNFRGQRLFPRTHATSTRSKPPTQGMAISSSSSGDANSRTSSWSRGSKRSQGLRTVARKKNVGGSGLARTGVRPAAKGAENVPITMPIPILVSDPEDSRKRKPMKAVSHADREMVTQSDSPINKKQKISRLGSDDIPSQKPRPVAPRKPIRIAKSTSSGMSAASSNVRARKKVGFAGDNKSVLRATRVRSGEAASVSQSGE